MCRRRTGSRHARQRRRVRAIVITNLAGKLHRGLVVVWEECAVALFLAAVAVLLFIFI
jgi:hypothetical protein